MTRTILLVDDDMIFGATLGRQLSEAQYDVVTTRGSIAALRQLETDRPIDLLLADLKLPDGQPHGVALSKMARLRRPGLPVIFMSGFPGLVREARLDEPVFEKPFHVGVLLDVISLRIGSGARR